MNRPYESTTFGSLFSAVSSLVGPMHGMGGARTLRPGTSVLAGHMDRMAQLPALLTLWHRRARQRLELTKLDDHLLDDIGLTREEVEAEARKPFWRA